MNKNLCMHVIWTSVREKIGQTVLLAAAALASVLLSLIPPIILKNVIDQYLGSGNTSAILYMALLYVSIYFVCGIADFLKSTLLAKIGQHIIFRLREQMMAKMERIHTSYFTANTPSEITSRIINDVNTVSGLFTNGVVSMSADLLKIIGVLISISVFSMKLMWMMLILIAIIFVITRIFQKNVLVAQKKNLAQLAIVNSHIGETIHCFRMIHSFFAQTYMEELYNRKLTANYNTKKEVLLYDSLYSPIIQTLRAIAIILIAFAASGIGLNFGLSIGMLAASIEYVGNLLSPIESLGEEFQSIQSGISGAVRINEFALTPEQKKPSAEVTLESLAEAEKQEIVFDHMSFSYQPDVPVFTDFSLTIPAGNIVTLTGRTGIGKTTMFNLTAGLLSPDSGKVTINGVPSDQIPENIRRSLFGYIEQNFSFIPGTVAEQITLNDERITNDQVVQACRFVGLDEWIMKLEKGYETDARGGQEFSWGQRQLLAIARAIVSNPRILLLDEISANLDAETEKNILQILQKASAGRTILAISHRPSSILQNSRVVNIEKAVG